MSHLYLVKAEKNFKNKKKETCLSVSTVGV